MAYENLDRRLINSLLDDGRASLNSLAENLGVSVTTVSNHVENLERKGIITGYKPVVNYSEIGYNVTAILHLSVNGDSEGLIKQLSSHDQLTAVYEITGNFDVIAIGKFADTNEMNNEIKTVLDYGGIEESNTSVALNGGEKESAGFEVEVEQPQETAAD